MRYILNFLIFFNVILIGNEHEIILNVETNNNEK